MPRDSSSMVLLALALVMRALSVLLIGVWPELDDMVSADICYWIGGVFGDGAG